MGLRTTVLLLLMLLGGAVANASDKPQLGQIHLVSEDWLDYTNADGTGLAWDVLRQVFEPAGVKVSIQSAPYSRAIGLVKRGEADAWVGSYKQESDDNLYPRWHFDVDHIYALGLTSKPVPTPANIGDYRLAWVRGYDYGSYLPNVHEFREIQRREGILPMLEHNRVDFYVDSLTEVEYVQAQAPKPDRFRRTHVAELPLYLAFAHNEQGKALSALFDQRMQQLVRSGELEVVFKKWKQPYPFTADSQPR